MADFTSVLNNFSGGKVSEKFKGRFDIEMYKDSLEEFKNFFIGKIGGAYRRTGTVSVGNIESIASVTEDYTAIPFDSGRGLPYIVYLPNDSINLNSTKRVRVCFTDDPPVSSLLNYVVAGGVYPNWSVADGTAFSRGNWVWQQVGDLLFITHTSGEQRPLVLTRVSESEFKMDYADVMKTGNANMAYLLKVPYVARNTDAIALSVTGTTCTASVNFFTADMVGAILKIGTTTEDVVIITAYTNPTTVTVSYLVGSSTTSTSDDWTISAWNQEYGWPSSVTYHDQRIFWGGNPKFYDTVWGSKLGNLFHLMLNRLEQDEGSATDVSGSNYFGDPIFATDPLDFKPASTYANSTTWISGGRVLMVGTSGGENVITIGADNLNCAENSNYGSFSTNVVKAGKDVIYVGKDGRTLRTYRYSDKNGSWLSDDLSSKAENIFFDGAVGTGSLPYIKQLSWNPDTKQLWVLLSNYSVKVLSYEPEYGLAGWSEFEIGGGDIKKVIGITCLPNNDRTKFYTYFTVDRRYPDTGTAQVHLERHMGEFLNDTLLTYSSTDILDFPRFLDGATLATADGSGIVSGLNVIYSNDVYDCIIITSTGVTYQTGVDVVFNSPNYELNYTFPADAKVLYGFSYSSELKMLPLDSGGVLGSAIADIKDISRVFLKLYRSIGFSIGSKDQRSGNDLGFETVSLGDDLYTGEKEVFLFDNPDSEEQVIIRHSDPTPLNILAMIVKGDSKR